MPLILLLQLVLHMQDKKIWVSYFLRSFMSYHDRETKLLHCPYNDCIASRGKVNVGHEGCALLVGDVVYLV